MNSDLQDELAGLRATFQRLQLEHAHAKELPDEGTCLHLLRLRCWLDAVELFRLKFLAPACRTPRGQ
jgi:hypothetical protein